jgi:hypothetical protein
MNQVSAYYPPKHHNRACSDLMTMAERELAAFFNAVKELFGSKQARLSAEDWLDELAARNGLPASTREWRRITVEVSARLARRVNALNLDRKDPLPVHNLLDERSRYSSEHVG